MPEEQKPAIKLTDLNPAAKELTDAEAKSVQGGAGPSADPSNPTGGYGIATSGVFHKKPQDINSVGTDPATNTDGGSDSSG